MKLGKSQLTSASLNLSERLLFSPEPRRMLNSPHVSMAESGRSLPLFLGGQGLGFTAHRINALALFADQPQGVSEIPSCLSDGGLVPPPSAAQGPPPRTLPGRENVNMFPTCIFSHSVL